MKIKNKKTKLMLLSIAVFSASFFAIAFSENVRAVNVPAVPCLCKTSLDSMQNSGTKYFASEADCDQYCSTNYGKNAVYALGIGGGEYKPVTKTSGTVVNTVHTCVCTNEGIYSNAITGTFAVNNESSCISQCRSFSSKIYQYDNKWKDLPVASDQVQTIQIYSPRIIPWLFSSKIRIDRSSNNDSCNL